MAIFVGSRPCASEVLAVPFELELEAAPVTVELDGARLEIAIEGSDPPRLRGELPTGATGSPVIELLPGGGGTAVRRIDGDQSPILLSLTLPEDAALTVTGERLGVLLRATAGSAAEAGALAGPAGNAGGRRRAPPQDPVMATLRFDLLASTLDLDGARGVVVEAERSQIALRNGSGVATLALEGGAATVVGWNGLLAVDGRGADLRVGDVSATLDLKMAGGSAELDGGRGQVHLQLVEAQLRAYDWRGQLDVKAEDTDLAVTSLEAVGKGLTVDGERLTLRVEDLRGPVHATLRGGVLDSVSTSGGLTVEASDGAVGTVADAEGDLRLTLATGARLELSNSPRAMVQAKLDDATLELSQVQRAQLQGLRADLTLSAVRELGPIRLTDSVLSLDLGGVAADPRIVLAGSTRAVVTMEMPCTVRVSGTDPWLNGARVRVDECDLLSDREPVRRRVRRRQLNGAREVQLNVQMDDDGELEVSVR